MQNLKKAGYPLMFAAIVLFGYAKRSDGMLLNWIAAGMMVVGMVLFVISAIFPPPDVERGSAAPVFSPPSGAPAGNYYREAARRGMAGPPTDVPAWVYGAALLMTGGGAVAFFLGPNGVSPRTVIPFAMIPGGVVFFLACKAWYGGAVGRRNIARGFTALVGFFMVMGGIFTGVLMAAGAFDRPMLYAAPAVAAFLAGLFLVYYGFKYQQSAEGVAIGRELGFKDAESGFFARDGVYDSVGDMNGVEVKINVEQSEPEHTKSGRTIPAHFRLEVLCGCANVRGCRFEVRPDGILSFNLTGLPKLPPLEYWDGYNVMSDSPAAVTQPLQEAKAKSRVFSSEAGLAEISLEGNDLRAVFELEGRAHTSYVRDVLGELTNLSLAFSK
jgi:hypothetical protein